MTALLDVEIIPQNVGIVERELLHWAAHWAFTWTTAAHTTKSLP